MRRRSHVLLLNHPNPLYTTPKKLEAAFYRNAAFNDKAALNGNADRTMVEPDLLVICKQEKIRMRCCFGAPDLVIEILSPSTKRKDIRIKTSKYANAGVREYWMIDPDTCQVLVYDFTKDIFPKLYEFDPKVPVNIWDGAFEVEFNEISREIAFIYENEAAATQNNP